MASRKKKKILFVEPAIFTSPALDANFDLSGQIPKTDISHGLFSMASFLNSVGYQSKILHLHSFFQTRAPNALVYREKMESEKQFAAFNLKVIRHAIETFAPDVVGISVISYNMEYGARVAVRILKKLYPNIKIVLGGTHVTFTASKWFDIFHNEEPDVVVLGEGEEVLLHLLDTDFRVSENIPGLMFRNDAGDIISTGLAPPVDLNRFSTPFDYSLYILPDEFDSRLSFRFCVFTRGCIHDCSFCLTRPFYGKKIRIRPIEHVNRDLDSLINLIPGDNTIYVWDSMFLMNRQGYRDACDLMKVNSMFNYRIFGNLNHVSAEEIRIYNESNIRVINFGLQHNDPEVLKQLHRIPPDNKHVLSVLQECKKHRIRVVMDAMLGCPGSTFEKDMKLFDYLNELLELELIECPAFKIVQMYPGTKIAHSPYIRIIEDNTQYWSFHRASHEVLDETGNVVYSSSEIEKAYSSFEDFVVKSKGAIGI